jgi:subtilisin-like proprotein convertase family protein
VQVRDEGKYSQPSVFLSTSGSLGISLLRPVFLEGAGTQRRRRMTASKSLRTVHCLLLAILIVCLISPTLTGDIMTEVARTAIPGVPLKVARTAPIPHQTSGQPGGLAATRVTCDTWALPAERVEAIVKGRFDGRAPGVEIGDGSETISGKLSFKIPLDGGFPQGALATNPLYLNSGILNQPIVDLGTVTVALSYGGYIPAGAAVTGLEYRMQIEHPGDPADFFAGDYEIYLFSGGGAREHLVYDNLGGHTDGGFDDDPEDDSDIYLNWRVTNYFNGESLDQEWGVWIDDIYAGDYGILRYLEFNIYWEILPNLTSHTPSGWDGPIVASSVPGTNTDGPFLQAGDSTYIDWSMACYDADVSDTFFIFMYVDEIFVQAWFTDDIYAGWHGGATDFKHVFDVGPHEVCFEVDTFDDILESDETDNYFCREFYWQPPHDWGDAPDPPYLTLIGADGARHVIDGPWLGNESEPPDSDPDGQPDAAATGDDSDGNDDENGVEIPDLVPGAVSNIIVEVFDGGTGTGGILDAWIDFDGDGVWSAGEKIHSDWLPGGMHTLPVSTPGDAMPGQTFGRFRFSVEGGLEPTGPAQSGEVEDHEVWIVEEQQFKWLQPPDLGETGIDIHATRIVVLADDYLCTEPGHVVEIWIWGSWLDDYLPAGDPAAVDFTLSFHSDIPADMNPDGYSIPGELLWHATFAAGEFAVSPEATGLLEGWMIPPQNYWFPADTTCWLYRFFVPAEEAFCQWGTELEPVVYWLDVQAYPLDPEATFGWKTSLEHWNDDAVWGEGSEPFAGPWSELRYPPAHPYHPQSIDLAFSLRSEPAAGVPDERKHGNSGLYQNEPNPFTERTIISYSLAESGPVKLEIFNVMGRVVSTLVDAVRPAGLHSAVWTGVDDKNRQLPAGIYFCRLTVGRQTDTRKMLYLK